MTDDDLGKTLSEAAALLDAAIASTQKELDELEGMVFVLRLRRAKMRLWMHCRDVPNDNWHVKVATCGDILYVSDTFTDSYGYGIETYTVGVKEFYIGEADLRLPLIEAFGHGSMFGDDDANCLSVAKIKGWMDTGEDDMGEEKWDE